MANKIFLVSDWHFCHNKPFLYEPRGFTNVEDMNEAIVHNHNEIVDWGDIVYVLGDCCLTDTERGIKFIKRLNGQKYLAFGNHCTDSRLERFKEENIFYDIQFGYRLRYGKFSFWLSHYPMKMGNFKDKHPVWNLSGHTHKKDKFENGADCVYNISLDAHENYPVSLDEIVKDIEKYRYDHPNG
jgi:calcineurin-like phosphoesterase family protein